MKQAAYKSWTAHEIQSKSSVNFCIMNWRCECQPRILFPQTSSFPSSLKWASFQIYFGYKSCMRSKYFLDIIKKNMHFFTIFCVAKREKRTVIIKWLCVVCMFVFTALHNIHMWMPLHVSWLYQDTLINDCMYLLIIKMSTCV